MTDMRIAALRRERGWTQEHLASVSGVGVRTIQRLEAGDEGSLETLRRVAAALEVPVPDLFAAVEPAVTSVEHAAPPPSVPPAKHGTPSSGRGRVVLVIGVLGLVGSLIGGALGVARPTAFQSSTHAFVSMGGGSSVTLLQASTYLQEVAQADAQLVTEPIVLDRAAARLGTDGRDLRGAVSARVEAGTVLLLITARGGSAAIAERRVNAVVQSLIDVVPQVSPSGVSGGQRITRVDGARTSTDLGALEAGGGIGLGGGLLVGLAVALIRRRPLDPPGSTGRLAIP